MNYFLNLNQAPGQVRGPRRLGGRAGIEELGFAEKDCRKAAPKEEQGWKSCESNCQGIPQGETPQGGAKQQQPKVGPQGEMSGNEQVKLEDPKAPG